LKSRVAIIAAMEREIRPLVRGWKLKLREAGVVVYSSEDAVAAFAGIGARRATLAAEAALSFGPVHQVVSVGWAGGLHAELQTGVVQHISVVIDGATGEAFATEVFDRSRNEPTILVSSESVASVEEKRRLREMFRADLVDMEAAAVARVARASGIQFGAIKAVSDEHDFELAGMEQFSTPDGQFREGDFAAYVALRPIFWKPVVRLAKSSAKAARNLCGELERYLATEENRTKTEQEA
jgi:adenosylhomocysteine nucleosidase